MDGTRISHHGRIDGRDWAPVTIAVEAPTVIEQVPYEAPHADVVADIRRAIERKKAAENARDSRGSL